MIENNFPLLVLSGPIGVGKTTVGQEISNQLDCMGVAHTFVDLDFLTQTYPRPSDDPFGYRLAFKNLQALWANSVDAGSRNLVVSRVVESDVHFEEIQRALPDGKATICQLQACDDNLLERVGKRELGTGLDWHAQRSLDLAQQMRANGPADFTLETDGKLPADIARLIISKIAWDKD